MRQNRPLRLSRLFEPARIGSMEVGNRIVMSPMGTGGHGPRGELTDRTAEYYAARARGGVGLIICQSSVILWESRAPFRASAYDDRFIPGLRMVADAIHAGGAKAAFQLVHHGRLLADYREMLEKPEDIRPLAPSAISRLLTTKASASSGTAMDGIWSRGDLVPEEATREDLRRVCRGFAEAARRVKRAGFDAVEIHGGHGYLISQFLSPLANRRGDEYGGGAASRARLACEVIAEVRKEVGADYPVLFRFSASDFLPGGIRIEDSVRQVPLFVEAGADALDVSASEQASIEWQYPSYLFPQGTLVELAARVKAAAAVPVIAVGKIRDPGFADSVLERGKADFIALGRALLADPDWPRKAREGREEEIRPCIYCLNCLHFSAHPHMIREGIGCAVNPAVRKEREMAPSEAETPRRVMVVGGGPAGMEAARRLAQRGHRVELHEQRARLGGQWDIACRQIQKREDYTKFLRYLEAGLEREGVDVHLNSRVTPERLRAAAPDVVVVATGAAPASLDVPGAGGDNVVQAVDVLLGRASVGRRVVVVGGRTLGMELADQLAEPERHVSLVSRGLLGRGVERNLYLALRNRLMEKGVHLYPNCPVVEIRERGAYVIFQDDLVFLPADSVVLAVGMRPERGLVAQIEGMVPEIHQIGDCVEPRDLLYAVREAAEVARII